MTFLVEMAPPGLGNLCQVLHSGALGRRLAFLGVTPRIFWGDASHFFGRRLAFFGVTPRIFGGDTSQNLG